MTMTLSQFATATGLLTKYSISSYAPSNDPIHPVSCSLEFKWWKVDTKKLDVVHQEEMYLLTRSQLETLVKSHVSKLIVE